MSDIVDFFLHDKATPEGFLFVDIVENWPDYEFEECHSHIQWLFPLAEPSQFNPRAPLFTQEDWDEFRNNAILRIRAMSAFDRALWFYGFFIDKDEKITQDGQWHTWWSSEFNHNFLRITRILRSMRLMGHEEYSKKFLDALIKLEVNFDAEILYYWTQATYETIGVLSENNNLLTGKDLKQLLDGDCFHNAPIVACIDGHFGYVTNIEPALASTWDNNRVWVLTKEEAEVSEYPVKKALEDKRLVPVIYLQCQMGKNESS